MDFSCLGRRRHPRRMARSSTPGRKNRKPKFIPYTPQIDDKSAAGGAAVAQRMDALPINVAGQQLSAMSEGEAADSTGTLDPLASYRTQRELLNLQAELDAD
jgi:hypothetical protein